MWDVSVSQENNKTNISNNNNKFHLFFFKYCIQRRQFSCVFFTHFTFCFCSTISIILCVYLLTTSKVSCCILFAFLFSSLFSSTRCRLSEHCRTLCMCDEYSDCCTGWVDLSSLMHWSQVDFHTWSLVWTQNGFFWCPWLPALPPSVHRRLCWWNHTWRRLFWVLLLYRETIESSANALLVPPHLWFWFWVHDWRKTWSPGSPCDQAHVPCVGCSFLPLSQVCSSHQGSGLAPFSSQFPLQHVRCHTPSGCDQTPCTYGQ